ncbi:MAG: hypothetical protein ACJ74B_03720 [Gaiellaceae bacterium]
MRHWPVVAGVLAGLAAAAIWTLAQPDRFRADARLLVRPASVRLLPAVEALAESSAVASNVQQTLQLASRPDLTATRGDSGVLTVSAEAGTREQARQLDAETIVVLQQRVGLRFPRAETTVLDPAHAAERTSPTAWRNLLITVGLGLALGVAATMFRRKPAQPAPAAVPVSPPVDREAERRLQTRIDRVARRERALAQRAGQLAAREHELGRREEGVEQRAAELEAAAAAPEPEPEPEPEPAPLRPAGRWTLQELEALTQARSAAASPGQQQDWSTYLFLLREHAGPDGTLPSSFDTLVNDVFGPLPSSD